MATSEDNAMCDRMFSAWAKEFPNFASIIALSPSDYELRRLRRLYPTAKLLVYGKHMWDLNLAYNGPPVDLITACNVFHYSSQPGRWFANVLKVCKQFWMQDLIVRPRGVPQLGNDGDACRFTYGREEGFARSWPVFDLNVLGDKVREFRAYDAGSYAAKAILINFVARIEGSA